MTFVIALIAIAAFLSGSAIGILAILVAGIRSGERARNLTSAPRTGTETVVRRLVGIGVRRPEPCRRTNQQPEATPGSDLT
jgi:hypothetical protein